MIHVRCTHWLLAPIGGDTPPIIDAEKLSDPVPVWRVSGLYEPEVPMGNSIGATVLTFCVRAPAPSATTYCEEDAPSIEPPTPMVSVCAPRESLPLVNVSVPFSVASPSSETPDGLFTDRLLYS